MVEKHVKMHAFYKTDNQKVRKNVYVLKDGWLKSMQKCIHSIRRMVKKHVNMHTFYKTDGQKTCKNAYIL